jgi:IstB-like ATP binding protein
MSTTDVISPDLKTVLRRLRLSPILATLPERLALARQQQIAHQDFLLLVLADETARRDSLATSMRVQRARLDPAMQLELWDTTARVTYDQTLWQELVSLRFLEQHKHLIICGPVGVGVAYTRLIKQRPQSLGEPSATKGMPPRVVIGAAVVTQKWRRRLLVVRLSQTLTQIPAQLAASIVGERNPARLVKLRLANA